MATMIEPTPELLARVAQLGAHAQAELYAEVKRANTRIEAMLLKADKGVRLASTRQYSGVPGMVAEIWGFRDYAHLDADRSKHGGMPSTARARGQVCMALLGLGLTATEAAKVAGLDRATVYYHREHHAHRVKFEHEYRTRWGIVIRKLTENGLLKAQAPVHR
jgi:DNA-binding CsgD family transcriptional regulator